MLSGQKATSALEGQNSVMKSKASKKITPSMDLFTSFRTQNVSWLNYFIQRQNATVMNQLRWNSFNVSMKPNRLFFLVVWNGRGIWIRKKVCVIIHICGCGMSYLCRFKAKVIISYKKKDNHGFFEFLLESLAFFGCVALLDLR